jgi:tetratricopeptide (TPR) repeat protein
MNKSEQRRWGYYGAMRWILRQTRNSVALALTRTLLLEVALGAQPSGSGIENEPWMAALQDAVNLSRRGEYREAMEKYAALLSTSPVRVNAEIHAYVLSQMADAERTGALAREEDVRSACSTLRHSCYHARTDTPGDRGTESRLQLCRQAVDIFEKAGAASRIELGSAYQNLAVVYALRGKPRKALDAVNLALATLEQALPPNHPFIVYALSTKVVACNKLKAFRQAEEMIPEMLRLGESNLP